MNRELLVSYAQSFASLLFRTPGTDSGRIRSIYLFGSVARGDFDEDSDIDIFIDTGEDVCRETLKAVRIILKKFYDSDECRKFQLLGVKNTINAKCGDLKKWELFSSVKSGGIILYSSSMIPFLRKYFLVELKPVKDIAKRNRVIRKLAGRKEIKRKEKGIVEGLGGQVLDSRHYIVPAEKISSVTRIFSKENMPFEIKEIWI